MRRASLLALPSFVLLLLVAAAPAVADHCGAKATVKPASGPPSTVFVFRTNLGAASDLTLSRNGVAERTVFLRGDGFVRYDITTAAGDQGTWRARAEVRGHEQCVGEANFTVIEAPDTSTLPGPPSPFVPSVLVLAGAIGLTLGVRRAVQPKHVPDRSR
jgi:hypothetical protein